MARLQNVPVEDLEEALGEVGEKETTQRLMVAIGYKRGLDVEELADWYGLDEDTIDEWFEVFETKPLDRAIDETERYSRERQPPFVPQRSSRVEYLNYEVLDDFGWDLTDEDLFEKAHDADLDAFDFGRITVEPGESILQAAENRGFDWPFACRGGACSNCAVILKEGEIAMPGDHILPQRMVEEYGARLTCVGVPATEEVKLVFNAKHLPELDELRLPPEPFLAGEGIS